MAFGTDAPTYARIKINVHQQLPPICQNRSNRGDSDVTDCDFDVPQGSVLGPLFFSACIYNSIQRCHQQGWHVSSPILWTTKLMVHGSTSPSGPRTVLRTRCDTSIHRVHAYVPWGMGGGGQFLSLIADKLKILLAGTVSLLHSDMRLQAATRSPSI